MLFRVQTDDLTYTIQETTQETSIQQFIETRDKLMCDMREAHERLKAYLNEQGYVFSEIAQTSDYVEDLQRYHRLKDELCALLLGVSQDFLDAVRQYEREAH